MLQRAAGGWRLVGEVAVDSPDLVADLRMLREKTNALEPGELRCKVIIPNDQIRYVSVETGSFDGAASQAMVRSALAEATPYAVDDLVFDISVDGTTTYVAAVVRDTLVEAENFAVEHGFNPLCFVAAPGDNPFLGEPFFGASAHASTLSESAKVESDGIAVVVIGPVELPDANPDRDSGSEPAPTGFSSRRAKANVAPDTPPNGEPDPVVFQSAKAKADDAARMAALEQTAEAAGQVSVIAPSLDIPEHSEPVEEAAADQPSGFGAFLSRRKTHQRIEPAPTLSPKSLAAGPAIGSIPAAPPLAGPFFNQATAPELTAISRPDQSAFASATQFARPDDEAARMTVFGARGQAEVGGKPRHLGLILSVALLVFLAAIAAWATIFLDGGVAGLFRDTPPKTELAAVPDTPGIGIKADEPTTGQTTTPATNPTTNPASPTIAEAPPSLVAGAEPTTEQPDILALLPLADIDVPSLPAPRRLAQPAQPAPPNLTDTDSAVLDALRQPDPDQPAPEQTVEIAPEIATESNPEPNAADEPATTGNVAIAAGNLLASTPQVPKTPAIIGLDDLYIASIDRTDLSQDAVALPSVAKLDTDLPLAAFISPVAAGTAFDLDAAGLVEASVEGTLNPDGIMVYLGRPAIVPPAVPARPDSQADVDSGHARLAGRRPRARPDDLEERFERNHLGGLTRAELGGLRPKARPVSDQQIADPDQLPTAQAVVASSAPRSRPANIAALVSAAIRTPLVDDATAPATPAAPATPIAPATVTPSIPSSVSVARQATLRNEINLRRVNLIGVYGSPSNRRALVRLPSGRYKKVKVGDSVDGGRVVAIGDSELRYQKSGRSLTLKIPSS